MSRSSAPDCQASISPVTSDVERMKTRIAVLVIACFCGAPLQRSPFRKISGTSACSSNVAT